MQDMLTFSHVPSQAIPSRTNEFGWCKLQQILRIRHVCLSCCIETKIMSLQDSQRIFLIKGTLLEQEL